MHSDEVPRRLPTSPRRLGTRQCSTPEWRPWMTHGRCSAHRRRTAFSPTKKSFRRASGSMVPMAAPIDAHGRAGARYDSLSFAPTVKPVLVDVQDVTSNFLKVIDFFSDGLPSVGTKAKRCPSTTWPTRGSLRRCIGSTRTSPTRGRDADRSHDASNRVGLPDHPQRRERWRADASDRSG